ncbi:MAG: polysaccharide deacetylase family protein [Bacteroidales bacterium]
MYLVKSPKFLSKLTHSHLTWQLDKDRPFLYLTFDDGPIPGLTADILDILSEKKVQATFFHVGDNIRKHPRIFEHVRNNGHAVGNHTMHHLNGWRTPNLQYIKDIMEVDEYYKTRLFRPPYGRIKPSQVRLLRQYYQIVMWSVMSGDFDRLTSKEQCYQNVANHIQAGAIIVFHDNLKAKENVLYALPRIIDYAKNLGYEFKILGEDIGKIK